MKVRFSQENFTDDCRASQLMANRSNRRRQNPGMSRCEKHEKAIGTRRANSPLWPCIDISMRQMRPDIRKQSNLRAIEWNACKPRRGPYTDILQTTVNGCSVLTAAYCTAQAARPPIEAAISAACGQKPTFPDPLRSTDFRGLSNMISMAVAARL